MTFDIKIMDSAMLEYLKNEKFIQKNINKYSNYTSNDWIVESCPYSPFIDTRYQNINTISLDMSAEKGKESATEYNNVKSVYSALKFLSDSTASEERLWAALCLGPFYSYVQYRWGNYIQSINGIKQHFFFEKPNRRALSRNALSRLWWIGRLTYDGQRKDPYELTRVVCSHADFVLHFIERNTSNNLHIIRPFLEAVLEEEKKGIIINTTDFGELEKYLNLLGGMYILDVMPEEWIKEKRINKIHQIAQRGIRVLQHNDITKTSTASTVDRVKSGSIVTVKCQEDGKLMELLPRKMKYRTHPISIIGLRINDELTIMKKKYIIIGIK